MGKIDLENVPKAPTWPPNKQGGCDKLSERAYDSSFLAKWNTCPKWCYWHYIRGLDLKGAPEAREWGFYFHEALSRWYAGKEEEECLEAFSPIPDFASEKYSRGRAITLFKEYIEKWGRDENRFKILVNESTFKIALDNGAFLTGRLDLIVEWDSCNFVLDHKTAGSVGVSFFKQFEFPHLQMDNYTLAATILTEKCSGVIINGISTAGKPQGDRFQRAVFTRTEEQIERSLFIVTGVIEEVEKAILEKKFLMRTSACSNYGGCIFRRLCEDEEVGLASGLYSCKEGEK